MKNSSIKERLNDLMTQYGLKQSDIVRRTGLDKSTISYYLSGKREPAQDNIFIIAQAFNVDPAWLMGYDVPMRTPLQERFSTDSAQLLVQIKNNPALMQLCADFMRLDPAQQQNVVNLVHSMIPDKRP